MHFSASATGGLWPHVPFDRLTRIVAGYMLCSGQTQRRVAIDGADDTSSTCRNRVPPQPRSAGTAVRQPRSWSRPTTGRQPRGASGQP
jgi:hypothetical protein